MLVAFEPEVLIEVAPRIEVVPFVTVNVFPVAIVVSPFKETAPVPVPNVPVPV